MQDVVSMAVLRRRGMRERRNAKAPAGSMRMAVVVAVAAAMIGFGNGAHGIIVERFNLLPPIAPETDATSVLKKLSPNDIDKAFGEANRVIRAKPGSPVGYNLLGAVYLSRGDLDNARKNFDKAISLQADYRPALLNLAEMDMAQEKYADAERRFSAVLAKDPKSVPAMLGLGKVEAAKRNDAKALTWIERAREADPNAVEPRILLAIHSMLQNNYGAALTELQEALRRSPDNPQVLSLMAKCNLALGDKSRAIATLKRLIALQPDSPFAYYNLGAAQAAAGDRTSASASLKKAVQLRPDYAEAVSALAALELSAGHYDEALRLARQQQTRAPKAPEGYVLEGDVLTAQRKYADAAAAYEKAIAMRETGLLTVKLHTALVGGGQREAADTRLQKWLAAHPDDSQARIYLAGDYARRNMAPQAVKEYEAILQRNPKDVVALNNLANFYFTQGDAKALDLAERAYALAPDSPAVADTLGWILVQQGTDATRGRELLRKAVTREPDNPEIRFHFAASLAKAGEKDRAREELKRLLSSTSTFPQRAQAETLLKQL